MLDKLVASRRKYLVSTIVKLKRVRGWSCKPNNQQNVCTTSVTEGEVGPVKRNFINICKISFNKRYLLYTYICYTPIATFQKAGTCLDAQQSMAKQPIKGCVSNHSRRCGKSVSEKSE